MSEVQLRLFGWGLKGAQVIDEGSGGLLDPTHAARSHGLELMHGVCESAPSA